jgi:hypothetical protein
VETGRKKGRFRRGVRPPVAIRWYGMTALVGHLRHLVAVAAASNQLDLRDWMRAEDAPHFLDRVSRVLGAASGGDSLAERLGRPVWIDFVADTGDDHDLSRAVARMLFATYALADGEGCTLPRGDVLIFGGDTAYPAATGPELERRLLRPWNGVLQEAGEGDRPRVLLGIPGNHDWYDGLDGFGRLFRRSPLRDLPAPLAAGETSPAGRSEREPFAGALERHLHLDEIGESLRLAGEAFESLAAILVGSKVKRADRLHLGGYAAVQEASYWALPLAPGLDLWGVDRQLRTADFRQRVFFAERRAEAQPRGILLVSPDPAFAFGEANDPGAKLLEACDLSMEKNHLFYLTGDVHHYERLILGDSLHVIAGGGGAFLHGSRIAPDAGAIPPQLAYPDKKTSLRIGLAIPWRLAAGTAGMLPHIAFGLLAAAELFALARGNVSATVASTVATLVAIAGLTLAVRVRLERPVATWSISTLFGLVLGLAPLGFRVVLGAVLPSPAWVVPGVILTHAFFGSFVLGLFLLVLALTGLEHHQGFAALGHPGFRHFVRLCVHPSGRVEGFVIGKDDPLGAGVPVLVDRFEWEPAGAPARPGA